MATFVNDLRLTELATGEGSGTWGTTTNQNLSLLGEAFSFGTEAITTNADTHTTTIADGSTDPGRSLFLKYTGTLDSACTITIGPNTVSKLWFIENATSGSQNIIIKQGSGSTITIPNGQTKAIYSDGAGSGGAMVDAFQDLSIPDLFVDDDLTIGDDLVFSSDSAVITFGADGDTTLTHTDGSGLTLNSTNKLMFNDASQFIQGSSATVLSLGATDEIDLTATAIDVNGTIDVSGNATLGGTLGVTGAVTANAGISIDNITIDGTEIDLSSGDLTIDVAGDIILDANGADVLLKDDGTTFGEFTNSSTDFVIKSSTSDKDMLFKGNDGGSEITALTLDMSAAGAATFNDKITAVGTSVFTNLDISGDVDIDGTTNLDVVDIDGAVDMASTLAVGGVVTANAGVVVDNFTIDGAEIDCSADMTIDVAGDLTLDVSGGDVRIKADGTQEMQFKITDGANVDIISTVADDDIRFRGNDGGSTITALTLDMSDAGAAAFNAGATFGGNVGIGASTVDEKLHVENSSGTTLVKTEVAAGSVVGFEIQKTGATTSNWRIVDGQVANGQFEIFDVTNSRSILNADSSEIVINDTSANLDFRVESDNNANLLLVDAGNDHVNIGTSTDYGGVLNIETTDNGNTLVLACTDTDANAGPLLSLYRSSSSSAADGDVLGTINFQGLNDANQAVTYAVIENRIVDASDGTEDGRIEIATISAGTAGVSRVLMDASETVFNENSKALDFRVESDGNANAILVDAANDRVGILNDGSMGSNFNVLTQMSLGADNNNRAILDFSSAAFTIGTIESGTAFFSGFKMAAGQMTFNGKAGTSPIFEMINNDNEDTDTGRETSLRFSGHRSGGEDVINAQISGHHAGSSDNDNGLMILFTNNGSGLDEKMRLNFDEIIVNQNGNDQDLRIESDNQANMLFVDAGNDVVNIGGVTVETGDALSVHGSDTNTVQRIYNTNAGTGGSMLIFQKQSSSPANDDNLGDIRFHGNDAAGNLHQFGRILCNSSNVTNGSEQGQIFIQTSFGGAATDVLKLGNDAIFNEGGNDIGFRVESDDVASMISVDSGNNFVGVGTGAPQEILHVFHASSTAAMRVSGDGNNNRKCQVEYNTTDGPIIRAGSSGIVSLKFAVDNSTLAGKFDTNADFYTNDGTVHSLSDIRVKTDVEDLVDGLDIVKQLKPRTFRYTEDSEFYNEDTKDEIRYGFVANEVEAVAPQYTDIGKGKIGGEEVDDLRSLSTTKMIPMLVKAIQEQQEQIEELKAEIATLKGG